MLFYQGYDDPLIQSAVAIDYYITVFATDPLRVKTYLRLFMAPGVQHCDGSRGANSFGATSQPLPPTPLDRRDDALIAWVERGTLWSLIFTRRHRSCPPSGRCSNPWA